MRGRRKLLMNDDYHELVRYFRYTHFQRASGQGLLTPERMLDLQRNDNGVSHVFFGLLQYSASPSLHLCIQALFSETVAILITSFQFVHHSHPIQRTIGRFPLATVPYASASQ